MGHFVNDDDYEGDDDDDDDYDDDDEDDEDDRLYERECSQVEGICCLISEHAWPS